MKSWQRAIAIALLLSTASFGAAAFELITAAQRSAPKFFRSAENQQMQGLCIDILTALTRIDPELIITGQERFLPSGRIYRALREGSLDIFCGSGKTPEREQQVIYLTPPLYQVSHRLLARRDDNVDIETFDDLRSLGEAGLTLTYLNSATHHYLKGIGGLVLEEGTGLNNLFERLMLGRGRFIYYHDLGLYHYVKVHQLGEKVRFLPAEFRSYSHYLVVSKQTPDSTREHLQQALIRLETSGSLETIYKKYSP